MASNDFIIESGVLKKYVGTGGDVVIPDGVTKIGAFAFDGCKDVTSVVISNSVTTIGKSAFSRCYGITSVTIPYGVTYIDEEAFWGCRKLKSLVIPASVRNIGDRAFQGCREMESVTLPVALKNIGLQAFDGYSRAFRREDVTVTASVRSTISTPTSSDYGQKTPTTSSVNKSKESSDKNESIISRFNRAIEKETIHTKQATTSKTDSAVKTPVSTSNASESVSSKESSYTSVSIPNQSTRLRMVKAYYAHPLRKEYEAEKERLYNKNPKRFIPTLVMLFPWIMIIVYGIIFFNIFDSFIVVVLGIINLFVCLCSIGWGDSLKKEFEKNTAGVDKLKAKYQQKGLYEVTESELLSSKCGEYDYNSEEFVCSATGERLSYMDYNWCQTPGNCKYCRRFVTAYVGDTKYWSFEIKR